ncbi:unnamed protein product [Phytophthora lilii]|uniref:Unnamed protein product n=1 Tax=Phytophthora lilii TaxID=2077276 RepID=A0A9W6XEX7_9STRA|nr:unnamed protein product [Phytophthora lilii]
MCGALSIDAFMTMFTVWDVVRNQWFWLGVPMIEYLPDGIRFMIATYVVVELAEPGHEGALYGLLTATTNLTTPFGRSMAKLVNAQFHVWLKDIQADTYVVRRDVASIQRRRGPNVVGTFGLLQPLADGLSPVE